jgi:hypothetical protein
MRLLRNEYQVARLSRLRPGEGRGSVHHLGGQTGYDQQKEERLQPESKRRPGSSESLFLPEVHRKSASAVVLVHQLCATNFGSSLSEINTAT